MSHCIRCAVLSYQLWWWWCDFGGSQRRGGLHIHHIHGVVVINKEEIRALVNTLEEPEDESQLLQFM